MTILWLLGSIVGLLLIRIPVAFALMLPCMAYIYMEPRLTMGIGLQRIAALLDSFPLLAVPLFILVGFVANAAGLADKLIAALLAIMGRIRGALAYVNVNASLVFSWMSGSAMADTAAMGSVLVPAMRRNGYDPAFAAAITAASSMIAPIMPPSISAVLYAVLSGTSVAALFLAGVIPALLIFATLIAYVFFYVRDKPHLTVERPPAGKIAQDLLAALPIVVAPVLLLGGILSGIFTPTEASAVTVVYLILLSFALGWMNVSGFYEALVQTAGTTGRIMLIASAGGLFSYVLAREGVPQQAADLMLGITDNPLIFLIILNIFLLIIGFFLEPASALLITVPVIFPIAMQFGIDPVHLGVIVVFNLTLGLLTPPVGLIVFMLSMITKVPFGKILRELLPILGCLFVLLLIITYVPSISLILPEALGY